MIQYFQNEDRMGFFNTKLESYFHYVHHRHTASMSSRQWTLSPTADTKSCSCLRKNACHGVPEQTFIYVIKGVCLLQQQKAWIKKKYKEKLLHDLAGYKCWSFLLFERTQSYLLQQLGATWSWTDIRKFSSPHFFFSAWIFHAKSPLTASLTWKNNAGRIL